MTTLSCRAIVEPWCARTVFDARRFVVFILHQSGLVMTKHSQAKLARLAATAVFACLAGATTAGAQTLTSGIDTTNFDRSIRPQDDFFRYVNGGWIEKTISGRKSESRPRYSAVSRSS